MIDPLSRSAILYGTDKFGYHDYTPNYYKLLKHLRDKPIKLLEIGVGGYGDDDRGGQSLRVWRDFFPKGEITGVDIQKKTMDLGPRVKIFQGSQVDADFLKELVETRGPFDVIIDDGSHRNEHIVESYQLLFPTLTPGGIYVAEDVQTSFHPRFGGSLTLEAPNSIGYFGDILSDLNSDSENPLIADVAGMERFHNMIALHKREKSDVARQVVSSSCFDTFDGEKPEVLMIGGATIDVPSLAIKTGKTRSVKAFKKGCTKGAGIVVAPAVDAKTATALLLDMADPGILVLTGAASGDAFAPDSDLVNYIRHRFTMVDHREISVHFPKAEIDALAANIYSVERFHEAVLFHISPNTYPSNFAFDAKNPQAARAIETMEAVLVDATMEGGLVQLADILTRHRSREATRGVLDQAQALGANSREYFLMASALAQHDRRMEDVVGICETAIKKFPLDPQFSVVLAAAKMTLREAEEAEDILQEVRREHPRHRAVAAGLVRILAARGKLEEAIDLARTSISSFPQPARPRRFVVLSRLLRQAGNAEGAVAAMRDAFAIDDSADILKELGIALIEAGHPDEARPHLEEALKKTPGQADLEKLLESAL